MRIIIVGGVAGGMSCATRLRREMEDAEIVVFERGQHVSFANCGLPYYVGEVITSREALLLQTPQSLGWRFNIDVRVGHEVVAIDRDAHTVTVRDLRNGVEADETYDALVLAPGASPFVPEIPGHDRALTLRDVADADRMEAAAENAQTAVIVGGGFIGVEVAENLTDRGIASTIVELADQVMAPLDPEMAVLVQNRLTEHGVAVELGHQLASIGEGEVTLDDGRTLPADLVVMAIGVRPETSLARDAGLAVGERGGIQVDVRQRTSDPAIFAVGDAVEKRDAVFDGVAMIPLAGPANRHGRLAADIIAGREEDAAPSLGTAIVGAFGLQAGATGWNEKRLRAAGRDYIAIHTHPLDHAGYYPGAAQMSLKLLVDPADGRILGAQGVGEAGVDKRIDVLATAMRGGLTAPDLRDLELTYAPQFGSAKDAVNMLGYIADNRLTGREHAIQWHEIAGADLPILDVRTTGEFERGHLDGALNIPLDELRARIAEVPDECIVNCQVGLRGYLAARIIMHHGKACRNLDGGWKTWSSTQALR